MQFCCIYWFIDWLLLLHKCNDNHTLARTDNTTGDMSCGINVSKLWTWKIVYAEGFLLVRPVSSRVVSCTPPDEIFNQFFSFLLSIFSSNNSDNHTDSPLQVLNYPGSVQEKERKLNEMILQLQMVREHLLSQSERVSELLIFYRILFFFALLYWIFWWVDLNATEWLNQTFKLVRISH